MFTLSVGGVLEQHLDTWEAREPELVKLIRKSLYVDDLIGGSATVQEGHELKQGTIQIFKDATFTLHKWNSNAPELEQSGQSSTSEEPSEVSDSPSDESTFAKQQLGTKSAETKLLRTTWNKLSDTLNIPFPTDTNQDRSASSNTKREVLSQLAKVYDPLGIVSPMTICGKFIFRDICEKKFPWDAPLNQGLTRRWEKWKHSLPEFVTLPRSIAKFREPINSVELHSFGDASVKGVCSAVYAIVKQESGTTQGRVTAKSRLAKQNLTIPRLELVAGHMAVNLGVNVRNAIDAVSATLHCWLDSTVALYWISGCGEHRQFVANRVPKINQHADVIWHHVPTEDWKSRC